jgi:hypothetical protein
MANRASVKMVLRICFGFLFLFGVAYVSQGQLAPLDQNRTSRQFLRISLNKAPLELWFPAGYDSVAQSTARLMDSTWLNIGGAFPKTNNRFRVILQNQGMVSNGFVSLMAPRAEFLTTATQDASLLGTNDWLPLLVSHELRHVHQNNAARRGLGKVIHSLFGSYGQSVYSNLLIPNWLWEGDAVETESRMNGMGRSYIPQFKMPLKAYIQEFGVPSYAKLNGKSYQQLVPNHYVIGQFLSQSMTQDFGQDFIPHLWQSTLDHPTLFGFSKQFKKMAGRSIDQYAKEKLATFSSLGKSNGRWKKGFIQYQYPNVLPDGRIIAVKSGFGDIKQLVEIIGTKERRLTFLGSWLDPSMLSSSSEYSVWAEMVYHPRWGQEQRSRLVFYSHQTGQKKYWGQGMKWINPSISPDSKVISLIELMENGSSVLRVYDLASKNVLAERRAKPGEQFLHPRLGDHNELVFISKLNSNKTLIRWDYLGNVDSFVYSMGERNIAHPYLSGDWIYMNFPNQEVDQIARLNLLDKRIELVSKESWGAYFAVPMGDSLIYSAYSPQGQFLAKKLIEPQTLILESSNIVKGTVISGPNYPTKIVSKWNIFQPFTWGPMVSSSGNQLEFSVISRDVLNSLQASAGVQYGMNERNLTKFARLSYQAWFPIIDFNFQSADRKTQLYIDNKRPLDSLRTDEWKQTTWDFGYRIPLNLTHSAYVENLQFGSNLGFLQVQGYDLTKRYYSEPFNGNYQFLKHQLVYSKLLSKSLWDVQSRKGFVFRANWNGTIFNQSLNGELWNLQAQLFLPGLFKHDGVSLRYAFQQESAGNYRFASSVNFPRGYLYTSFNQLSTMGVDYRFPISNTNINLGRLIYITRLKGNMFGDLGMGKDNSESTTQSFHSFGVDLSAQFHALRFSQEFELGVRTMYLSASKSWVFVPLVIDIGF